MFIRSDALFHIFALTFGASLTWLVLTTLAGAFQVHAAPEPQKVQLPSVVVTGHRLPASIQERAQEDPQPGKLTQLSLNAACPTL